MPEVLDLRGVPCPANTARAVLCLEGMDDGEILTVLLDDGEPIANVPPALRDEGHTILAVLAEDQGFRLQVRKGG